MTGFGGNTAEDIVLITDLLGRYCHIVDDGPIDRVAELFWDDATLVTPDGQEHIGLDEIVKWYRNWDTTMRAPVSELRHRITSPSVEIAGDHATSRCYVDADALVKGSIIGIRGRYDDSLERRVDEWRFAHRTIAVFTPPKRSPTGR